MGKSLNFKPRKADLAVIGAMVILVAGLKFMGINEIPENSLVENIQLIVLFVGIIFCFLTRNNPAYKTVNRFIAMILALMFLREISYGRCIFCQVNGNPHVFYSWEHYKYGYLVHFFVGIYIALIAIYGIMNEIWLKIWDAIRNVKFPVFSTLLVIICVALQLYAEKVTKSTFTEEIAELAIYSVIISTIYYYNNILSAPKVDKI